VFGVEEESPDAEFKLSFGSEPVEAVGVRLGGVVIGVPVVEADSDVGSETRSDDRKFSWNIGASRTISRVTVRTAPKVPAVSDLSVIVAVTTSGKFPCATPAISDPEHTPVGTAIWVSVEAIAMQVLPNRLWHWKPLTQLSLAGPSNL
jgi:hypothetical protein